MSSTDIADILRNAHDLLGQIRKTLAANGHTEALAEFDSLLSVTCIANCKKRTNGRSPVPMLGGVLAAMAWLDGSCDKCSRLEFATPHRIAARSAIRCVPMAVDSNQPAAK